jgi:hypothetical protein
MNELLKEILSLIGKLENSVTPEGSTEYITLSHLKRLVTALENTEDIRALEPGFADLEQFWATSVSWCFELSKNIEKIIILYREQL